MVRPCPARPGGKNRSSESGLLRVIEPVRNSCVPARVITRALHTYFSWPCSTNTACAYTVLGCIVARRDVATTTPGRTRFSMRPMRIRRNDGIIYRSVYNFAFHAFFRSPRALYPLLHNTSNYVPPPPPPSLYIDVLSKITSHCVSYARYTFS